MQIVWSYRRTGKFAFHVLTGALETDPELADIPIEFANGVAAVVAAIEAALARDERVLVGWSFYSPDFAQMTGELAAVRARVNDARVVHVAGGVHASAEPEQTLRAGFDLVAVGEGEVLVRDHVRALANGREPRDVQGIAWRGGARGRAARVDLDAFPAFAAGHDKLGPIEITRGCIYACRFCQTPYFAGATFRHRSLASVRANLRVLAEREIRDYRFLSPTSLSYGSSSTEPNLAAVEALLGMAREEIGAHGRLFFGTFPSELRPEHVTHEALAIVRRYAHNKTLILGGQSGSDRVLEKSARGHDAASIERAVAIAGEAGFVPHVDFIFGLPGEEPADVALTLALMDRLTAAGARVHGHTFMPLPGTPFRRAAPGAITPAMRRRLHELASQGGLYGQWEQQEAIGARLLTARSGVGSDPAPRPTPVS